VWRLTYHHILCCQGRFVDWAETREPATFLGYELRPGRRRLPETNVRRFRNRLRGMHDRVELFGGRFELVSAPGEGTLVVAVVPLLEGP